MATTRRRTCWCLATLKCPSRKENPSSSPPPLTPASQKTSNSAWKKKSTPSTGATVSTTAWSTPPHQFNMHKDGEQYVLAGYPWFKCRARDTFISLPGLTLSIGEEAQFEKYMDTAVKAIRQYINKEPITVSIYEMEQPDTLLWAIWCIQQLRQVHLAQEVHGTLWRAHRRNTGLHPLRTPRQPVHARQRSALQQRSATFR